MNQLPIVDFGPFLNGNFEEKQQVAKAMRAASESIGFFMLKNIGFSDVEVNDAFSQSQKFFNLPVSEKSKLAWESAESNRGYIAVKRETLDPTQKSDLKEAFNLGTKKTDQDPNDPAKNKWPESLPSFRTNIEPFIEHCTELTRQVLSALAVALDLDERFFESSHNLEQNTFRLLHYPALKSDEGRAQDEKRAGVHTDYGSITLLFQDEVGGLEVKSKSGEWVAATPVKDAIVVNIGDLMQRWTNDVFSSNPHRVTQPEASRNKDRYSIAYFCTSNHDEVIESISTCVSAKNPNKYPPITTQAHMLERLNRTY
jgi:isopenicillin N synthase-like dioxygenase